MTQAETFTLTLSMAASAEAVEAWFAAAAPGAREVYASGLDFPREAPVVALVRGWEAAGLVRLVSGRDPDDRRRTNWWVVKAGETPPVRPRGTAQSRVRARELDRQKAALLALLAGLARRRRACPSNSALARELDLGPGPKGRARAQYLLRQLAAEGAIAIENNGRNAPRKVRVLRQTRSEK